MAMAGNNENPLVKGPEPVQGAFVSYSFPAGQRIAKANSSSNRKELL